MTAGGVVALGLYVLGFALCFSALEAVPPRTPREANVLVALLWPVVVLWALGRLVLGTRDEEAGDDR